MELIKKKIMFDTNVFDKLQTIIEKLEKTTDNYEYYITTIQIDEIASIPDTKIETRKMNILLLARLRAIIVPLSFCVLGKARLGYAKMGNGLIYHNMLNENKNNLGDALIADTSVSEECTLITEDIKLYKKMKLNNYDAMTLNDFLNEIQKEI